MTKATSSILYKFKRIISGQGAARAGKVLTVFIANEDMDDIIKTVESLEDSDLLVDGPTETVKHEIKKQECGFFWCYDGTYHWFIDSIHSFFIDKSYIWERSHENRKRARRWIFPQFLDALLTLKAIAGKEVTRVGSGYNNLDHMDQSF